jgi:hypothetical protein
VRDTSRKEYQRAGPGSPRGLTAEPFELTLHDEERLVAVPVHVWRRRKARRDSVIDYCQCSVGASVFDLVDRQRVEKPESAAVVGCQYYGMITLGYVLVHL